MGAGIREGKTELGFILGIENGSTGKRTLSVNSTPINADDGTCKGALATFDDMTPDREQERRAGENPAPPATVARQDSPSEERPRSRQGVRRGRQSRQERISRQRQPRNPHADERHHGLDRCRPRNPVAARTARVSRTGQGVGRFAHVGHQRNPRLLQDRSGQVQARPGRVRLPRQPDRFAQAARHSRPSQRAGTSVRHSRRRCPTR